MGAVILLTVSPMDALIYVIILEILHQIESNVSNLKIMVILIGFQVYGCLQPLLLAVA